MPAGGVCVGPATCVSRHSCLPYVATVNGCHRARVHALPALPAYRLQLRFSRASQSCETHTCTIRRAQKMDSTSTIRTMLGANIKGLMHVKQTNWATKQKNRLRSQARPSRQRLHVHAHKRVHIHPRRRHLHHPLPRACHPARIRRVFAAGRCRRGAATATRRAGTSAQRALRCIRAGRRRGSRRTRGRRRG